MVDRLFVLWRGPHDEPARGRRHVIGRVWRDDAFHFGYVRFGSHWEEAEKLGFRLLQEFPEPRDVEHPYSAPGLFATFARRIPSPRRPDLASMLRPWGLTGSDDPFEILSKTGGMLLTDRLELAEWRSLDDPLTVPLFFRIARNRYVSAEELDESAVVESGPVHFEWEPSNVADPHAVRVYSAGQWLGFVPRQYSELFARNLRDGRALEGTVFRRLNLPPDYPRWIIRAAASGTATPDEAASPVEATRR